MPIEKVPVVHKFGIISHSQRLELQERLLKQSYLATFASKKNVLQTRNPLEVTEEFIQQYNSTESLDEKEKLDATAQKMLLRIKRRAGLKDGGAGEHVDLPVAWTELSQLAQCKGKIQEECLDVLITSLDQVALKKAHIPALFFLAETTLYWLRTDAVHQPYLRTGEIKLLKMGMLVFARLFYHHMAGQLQNQNEFKNRLFTYLDGFADCQDAYSPYPNALLCVRYINEVGKMIIGDCNLEAGEIKEGDNVVVGTSTVTNTESTDLMGSQELSSTTSSGTSARSDKRDSVIQLFQDPFEPEDETKSSHSAAISSSVHDLSPTLWHSLDVWRCVNHLGGGLKDAVRALGNCGMGLATESWVDGISAMQVLGDAAKCDLQVLRALQNLARGVRPRPSSPESVATPTHDLKHQDNRDDDSIEHAGSNQSPAKVNHQSSSYPVLSDIYEKSEYDPTSAGRTKGQPEPLQSESTSAGSIDHPPGKVSRQKPQSAKDKLQPHKTAGSFISKGGTDYTTVPNTAWKAEVGSELGPGGRASQASSVHTFTNVAHPNLLGLHGWHWEVAITYADVLADICLHGNTSHIQKMALVGNNKEVNNLHNTAIAPCCPLKSAGLLDLVYFHAAQESYDGSSNDWSWRVRYSAIQGLVKICRCCGTDQTKEGLRTVAWNTLVKAHSQERDQRVLEALKVGQVESNIENLIAEHMVVPSRTIGAKIASCLSVLYLPPLPPPVQASPRRRSQPKPKLKGAANIILHSNARPGEEKPLRTTLKEEILLATALYEPQPSFATRTSFDLKRIVEDQWRKELQIELDEDEEQRKKDLQQKEKEEEERQRQVEEKRRQKLHNKYKGRAYQFRDFSATNLKQNNRQSPNRKGSITELCIKSRSSSLNAINLTNVIT